jgi:hypothetical protein
LDDSEFVTTPQKAGEEMLHRILSASPLAGIISPYTQVLLFLYEDSNKVFM